MGPEFMVRSPCPFLCPYGSLCDDGEPSDLTLSTVDAIPLEDYPPLLKSNYATRLLYALALCFVKMSILVFYLRIDHRKWTRWAIYFLMFTVIGLTIATACILIFECWPVALFWDVDGQAQSPDKCMDPVQRQIFYEANGIIK